MSLLTLLEAAKYLDYRAEAQARGEEPHDYNTYASHLESDSQMSPNATSNSFLSRSESPLLGSEKHNFGNSNSKHIRNDDDSGSGGGNLHEESGDSGQRPGTREVHNRLEKNRRAHLKECFETLKKQLPNMDEKKTSNLSILRSALRYIQSLKRKQREYEIDLERLAREKILQQQRLASLKKELSIPVDELDISEQDVDVETLSTSTASETGRMTDLDDDLADNIEIVRSEPPTKPLMTIPEIRQTYVSKTTNSQVRSSTIASDSNQISVQIPSTPSSAMQTITVSKATGNAIAVNSLVNSLATQTAHVQIPAQMGLHVNGGANVITHPATVQVITPQTVRVISAAPNPVSLPMLNNAINHHVTSVSSTPTFAATVNVVTPRMASIAAVAATTAQKTTVLPTTMTLAKTNLLPVTVATVMSQPQKNLANNATIAMNQLAVKASGMPALNMPTTLTALSRAVTLHTTSSSTIQVTSAGNKPIHHVLQSQICAPRAVIPHQAINAQASHGNIVSANLNNVVRQVMAVKPGTQMRATPLATQITHVVQPGTGQIVTTGNHAVTPLMSPVNVVNHTATVAQVITAQPTLAKVTASPQILKSVPLVQAQQFLSSAQPIVKPVVMVPAQSVNVANGTVIGGGVSHPT